MVFQNFIKNGLIHQNLEEGDEDDEETAAED